MPFDGNAAQPSFTTAVPDRTIYTFTLALLAGVRTPITEGAIFLGTRSHVAVTLGNAASSPFSSDLDVDIGGVLPGAIIAISGFDAYTVFAGARASYEEYLMTSRTVLVNLTSVADQTVVVTVMISSV